MSPTTPRCPFTGRALPAPSADDLRFLKRLPGGTRLAPTPATADARSAA